jgi:structural toxin protein (hemagglutinin/hemolysin) RtxA
MSSRRGGFKVYKLSFYVPESHLEMVKTAVFGAGAGRIGDYDRCCWQVMGQGQFRPLAGSNPHLGQLDRLERVEEYRVEMVCKAQYVRAAVQAMQEAHPYEEPAWDVIELVTELPR